MRILLQNLKDWQLFEKFRNSEFSLEYVTFIRYFILREGIHRDPQKTNAVRPWTRTITPFNIRSFMDLDVYYIGYYEFFSSIVVSLTKLSKMKVKFQWLYKCDKYFQMLKGSLLQHWYQLCQMG